MILIKSLNKPSKREVEEFISEHPKPSDAQLHEWAEENGWDKHAVEETVYRLLGAFIGKGKSTKATTSPDPDQLQMGVKVEMEHTSDASLAEKIARDHLAEIPDYYTRLAKMESQAQKSRADVLEFLEKGKKLPVGTIREWGGKKYRKVNEKKWQEVKKGPADGKVGALGEEKELTEHEKLTLENLKRATVVYEDIRKTGKVKNPEELKKKVKKDIPNLYDKIDVEHLIKTGALKLKGVEAGVKAAGKAVEKMSGDNADAAAAGGEAAQSAGDKIINDENARQKKKMDDRAAKIKDKAKKAGAREKKKAEEPIKLDKVKDGRGNDVDVPKDAKIRADRVAGLDRDLLGFPMKFPSGRDGYAIVDKKTGVLIVREQGGRQKALRAFSKLVSERGADVVSKRIDEIDKGHGAAQKEAADAKAKDKARMDKEMEAERKAHKANQAAEAKRNGTAQERYDQAKQDVKKLKGILDEYGYRLNDKGEVEGEYRNPATMEFGWKVVPEQAIKREMMEDGNYDKFKFAIDAHKNLPKLREDALDAAGQGKLFKGLRMMKKIFFGRRGPAKSLEIEDLSTEEMRKAMASFNREDDVLWLNKGKGLPVGTVRDWKGKKFRKEGPGKWTEVKKGAAGGGGSLPKVGEEVTVGAKRKGSVWSGDMKSGAKAVVTGYDSLDGEKLIRVSLKSAMSKPGFDKEADYELVYPSELRGGGSEKTKAGSGEKTVGTPAGPGGEKKDHVGNTLKHSPEGAKAYAKKLEGLGVKAPNINSETVTAWRDADNKKKIHLGYKDVKAGRLHYMATTEQAKTIKDAVERFVVQFQTEKGESKKGRASVDDTAKSAEKYFKGYLNNGGSVLMSPTSVAGKDAFTVQFTGDKELSEDDADSAKAAVKQFLESEGYGIDDVQGQHIHPNDAWEDGVKHYVEYTFVTKSTEKSQDIPTDLMKHIKGEETFWILNKGRGLPIGTVREWKGKKFQKMGPGKWKEVKQGKGGQAPAKGGYKDEYGVRGKAEMDAQFEAMKEKLKKDNPRLSDKEVQEIAREKMKTGSGGAEKFLGEKIDVNSLSDKVKNAIRDRMKDEDEVPEYNPDYDDPEEGSEPQEPQEGDITMHDERGKTVVSMSGKVLGTFGTEKKARFFIKQYMDKEKYWPNVWSISDHGNAHLTDVSDEEEELQSFADEYGISDEEEVAVNDLLKDLGYEASEVTDISGDADNGGLMVEIGGEEYIIASEDEANNLAKEDLRNLLDDLGPTQSVAEWVWRDAIDEEKLGNDIAYDERDMAYDEPDTYLNEEPAGEDGEWSDEQRERAADMAEERVKEDPMGYLDGIYGEGEDLDNVLKKYIDEDKIIDTIIRSDGLGHVLSSYDGSERDLKGGYLAFRRN